MIAERRIYGWLFETLSKIYISLELGQISGCRLTRQEICLGLQAKRLDRMP